jgi:SAM-dependent methyltransferase
VRDDVKAFVELFARIVDPPGPVLEIGSLQTAGQLGYADLRPAFAGRDYLGCDLVTGPGVDRLEDAESLSLPDASVGTVVMADSLEHIADPRRAVAEVHRVLVPHGRCLIAAPFIFPIHHQPDYMRFTPEGMATLLAAFAPKAVLSSGDAQWPHTVYAVACKGGDGADAARFTATVDRLVDAWDADGRYDRLTPFVPLTTVARVDTGDVRAAEIGPANGPRCEFDCPAPGLSRIDVKLQATGERTGRLIVLTVVDVANHDAPLATASVVIRAPLAPRWVAFQFAAIAQSAGRRVAFRLSAPDGPGGTSVAVQVAPDGAPVFEALVRRAQPAR